MEHVLFINLGGGYTDAMDTMFVSSPPPQPPSACAEAHVVVFGGGNFGR